MLEQACEALNHLQQQERELLRQDIPVEHLFKPRCTHVDAVVRATWQAAGLKNTQAALLAVGGYGRGEMFPHSDVDVLVLMTPGQDAVLAPKIERFIRMLWDTGLHISHSARSLDVCLNIAADDITVATSLLEARLLAGQTSLFEQLEQGLHTQEGIWPVADFFLAKRAEQTARHRKFDHSGYKIEPNVKESPGGLRDWHMLRWLARRVLGRDDLKTMVAHGLLTQGEAERLEQVIDFLSRVRFHLHLLTRRHEDRLLLSHQKAIAAAFGHDTGHGNAGVEAFMQRYFRAVMDLERLNELVIQQFEERLFPPTEEAVPLNARFAVRKGLIETRHQQVFLMTPSAMLEVFLLMQQHPDIHGIRASTQRQLRSHLALLRNEMRTNPKARALFMDIIRQPHGVNRVLKRMNRLGLLAAYLPPFEQIVGRMQFDLFHLYTVDEHTLFVIRNLRRFSAPIAAQESPLAHELYRTFDKPELLILAALFHDIAKGRGGDHEILGAEEARAFCTLHGLPEEDTELVAWLVREHLSLSFTAQRRDIEDPHVVRDFAELVGNRRRLDALYMLTVADIRATNPTLWNEWRASLLRTLYRKTRAKLEAQHETLDLAALRAQTLDLLRLEARHDMAAAARLWDTLPHRHLIRNSPAKLAWQMGAILGACQLPLVAIRHDAELNATELFIYTPDAANIFARVAATLDCMGLDIQAADITRSSDGMAIENIIFLDGDGQPLIDEWTQLELVRQIEGALSMAEDHPIRLTSRRPSARLRHFHVPTEIVMEPACGNQCTRVQLETGDRPGLLARIGMVLAENGIRLQGAVVTTLGEKALDTFFVSTREGRRLDAKTCEQLARHLRQALHDPIAA